MIEHAVRVGATTARERVAERIAEALGAGPSPDGPVPSEAAATMEGDAR
jgi:hypothetical protein